MCTCNDGYQIDSANAMCLGIINSVKTGCREKCQTICLFFLIIDIDECANDPTICGVGTCVNTDGGYNCVCPEGYVLLPGGSETFNL